MNGGSYTDDVGGLNKASRCCGCASQAAAGVLRRRSPIGGVLGVGLVEGFNSMTVVKIRKSVVN